MISWHLSLRAVSPRRPARRGTSVALALGFLLALAFSLGTTSARAEGAAWWQITSSVRPAHLPIGTEGTVTLKAVNLGDGTTSGALRLKDVLPPGLKIQDEEVEGETVPSVRFLAFSAEAGHLDLGSAGPAHTLHLCEATSTEASCSTEAPPPFSFDIVSPVTPYEDLEMQIKVKNEGASSGSLTRGSITGGQTPEATTTRPIDTASSPTPFAVEDSSLSVIPEEEGGGIEAQAGSHPFQMTTSFALNQNADPVKPPALPQNIAFKLPAGLVGNTTALAQCSDHDFRQLEDGVVNKCSSDSVVGVASVTIDEPETLGLTTLPVPVFNLTPGEGEPARFGFLAAGTVVTLDTSVRTGSDYGVTVSTRHITELASFLSSTVTIWGTPGDQRHDESRGWGCLVNHHWGAEAKVPCQLPRQSSPKAFLTLPTTCRTPFSATVEGESWPLRDGPEAAPRVLPLPQASYTLNDSGREVQLTGCNQLPFAPSIDVQPDGLEASSPTGLTVRVRVPQEAAEAPEGLASSTVKDLTVTLPEGVTVNAASAGGLEACSEAEIGHTPGSPFDRFEEGLASPFCPDASKIGTAEIITPLLPPSQHLKGAVYLAAQGANPFNSLIAMYIVVRDPVSGVLVKIPGKVSLDPVSGRITTTLRDMPPLPFQEAIVKFFGGPRAPLATPALCRRPGEQGYATVASLGPWSGTEPIGATPEFDVTSGPGGSACPNGPGVQSPTALPFTPSLSAGTTNTRAGAFTPLTTTVSREVGNQELGSLQLHMPPGLAAMITGVTPCPEPQANEGPCGASSLIGHADVSVGVGSTPYDVVGGQVFLTGPHNGAPFGLSITSPAKAGPFDLGEGACDCIVVRASLQIDPHTAQVTVTTDSSGPYAIPHMLQGIPLQIRRINATVDRGAFAFNPTNCEQSNVAASIASDLGATVGATTPFQVVNCKGLGFAPKFTVSVTGRTSKLAGSGLVTKLTYPAAAQGTQANIAKVKVVLPKQLPSRLTTLQQACLAKVFEADPAKCPPHSIVGHARVLTPVLPVPLDGPAYFVSHGGEAFPALVIVLQGDGVMVDLVGSTLIRKGITSTTFKTTPDVPFKSFELTLPQGRFSALGVFGNLCKSKLTMPTEMIAQNGLRFEQTTKITATHCPKTHRKAAHRKSRHKKHG